MTDTGAKKTAAKMGLYVVSPEQKPGIKWPSIPSDALPDEGQYSYYARRHMKIHAENSNARVQSEIDEVTRRMIDVEQRLRAVQYANDDVTSLKEELARLQSERKAKKESLVFRPMKKSPNVSDQ
tara:strand:+ start:393 stop:767 length:375 start_codon:yes stop_codon:yes gene_type:complete